MLWLIPVGLVLGGCSWFREREKENDGKGPTSPSPAPSQPAQPTTKKCVDGYCEIPGGTFQMGSTNGEPDERPVKSVTMTGFLFSYGFPGSA